MAGRGDMNLAKQLQSEFGRAKPPKNAKRKPTQTHTLPSINKTTSQPTTKYPATQPMVNIPASQPMANHTASQPMIPAVYQYQYEQHSQFNHQHGQTAFGLVGDLGRDHGCGCPHSSIPSCHSLHQAQGCTNCLPNNNLANFHAANNNAPSQQHFHHQAQTIQQKNATNMNTVAPNPQRLALSTAPMRSHAATGLDCPSNSVQKLSTIASGKKLADSVWNPAKENMKSSSKSTQTSPLSAIDIAGMVWRSERGYARPSSSSTQVDTPQTPSDTSSSAEESNKYIPPGLKSSRWCD